MTSASDDSDAAWDEHVAYIRETFINQLVRRGMRLTRDRSRGATTDAALSNEEVTVTLGDGFPYLPPTVRTNNEVPRTWHQERNGNLCLFSSRDRDAQPWLDVDAFLERIDLWFTKNSAGWPDGPPALDIEVYLDLPLDPTYVLYADLPRLDGDYVLVKAESLHLRVTGPGKVPKKSRRGILSGYVTDMGELTSPPLDWSDLLDNVAEPERIRGAIERGRIDLLLIQYTRQNQQGVLAVTFHKNKQGEPTPHIALSGSTDPSTMQLRAGPRSQTLATKHVYVLGAGALGSQICDGLSRAGIGELTVRDGDLLTPGNMTRHLVTITDLCGAPKAEAVQVVLEARPYKRAKIHHDNTALTSPPEAGRLLREYSLVVDATADGAVTRMLEDAATATGRRFATACLQNEGRTHRIDIVPPFHDADPIPPTDPREPTQPEVFEAGCGEPISITPPHCVAEAAAMAVRHIVGILVGKPETSSGEICNHS